MDTLDLNSLYARLQDFASEREWDQFHTPKNLSMAVAGEAGELLENFQWLTPEQSGKDRLTAEQLSRIEEEICDVLIYTFRLADQLGMDVPNAIDKKMKKNARTYPVHSAKGNAKKHPKK